MPFTVYVVLFLGLPAVAIVVGAFQDSTTGDFTLSNIKHRRAGIYLHGFGTTLGVVGDHLDPAGHRRLPGRLRHPHGDARHGAAPLVITASGVFANFGGVPLAFLFIATLGTTGMVTGWLNDIGLNLYTTASTCTRSAGSWSSTCTSRSR